MGDETALTRLQVEEMIAAQRRAEISAQRNALLHGVELQLAELIGTDGDGGEWASFKRRFEQSENEKMEMRKEIAALTLFRHKVAWTVGGITAAGSIVGTIVVLAIQHFFK